MGAGRRTAALGAALIALALPCAALAAFPGADPTESPRANTPNDPGFDRCEADDPDTAPGDCDSYFEEQFGSFGFSPDSAQAGARAWRPSTSTARSSTSRAETPTSPPGTPQCSQISGVRADTAWKYSTGAPAVSVAILDTGIRWQDTELVEQGPPEPGRAAAAPARQRRRTAPSYDCNGDGAFNVSDYADDPRVVGQRRRRHLGHGRRTRTRSSTPPT